VLSYLVWIKIKLNASKQEFQEPILIEMCEFKSMSFCSYTWMKRHGNVRKSLDMYVCMYV
jgi:hypothetical protein